ANRSPSLPETAIRTSGTSAATPARPSTASPATSQIVARHPYAAPIHVPSGTPTAVATLIPPITSARARPRCSGPASPAATPDAVGVNMAAPAAASTRVATTSGYPGTTAVSTLPSTNTPSPSSSNVRRGKGAVTAASTGDSTAYASANTVMSCPAAATDTSRSAAIGASSPAVTNMPVPTAKFPAARG